MITPVAPGTEPPRCTVPWRCTVRISSYLPITVRVSGGVKFCTTHTMSAPFRTQAVQAGAVSIPYTITLYTAVACWAAQTMLSCNQFPATVLWYILAVAAARARPGGCVADVAGLHWSSSSEGVAGLEVRLDGFSHKLHVLLERVFGCLAGCEV